MSTPPHLYPTFVSFVEAVILPLLLEHPARVRLDGWQSGGNRDLAGRFIHDGGTWQVHADTHFEPLLLAYWSVKFSPQLPALVRAYTPKDGVRLDLSPQLQSLRGERPRYLYMYLEG